MAEDTGLIIGRALGRGVSTLGQFLAAQDEEKKRLLAAEEKKRLQKEEDYEESVNAAMAQLEELGMIDPDIAADVGMLQLQRERADGIPSPVSSGFINKLIARKEEEQEALAEQRKSDELAAALRSQPSLFEKPAAQYGYIPQDLSSMMMGSGMGDISPVVAELGGTPAMLTSEGGKQELGGIVNEIARALPQYFSGDETPTSGEFVDFIKTKMRKAEATKAWREGELAGIKTLAEEKVTGKKIPKEPALTPKQVIDYERRATINQARVYLAGLPESTRNWLHGELGVKDSSPVSRGIQDERDFIDVAYKLAEGREKGFPLIGPSAIPKDTTLLSMLYLYQAAGLSDEAIKRLGIKSPTEMRLGPQTQPASTTFISESPAPKEMILRDLSEEELDRMIEESGD